MSIITQRVQYCATRTKSIRSGTVYKTAMNQPGINQPGIASFGLFCTLRGPWGWSRISGIAHRTRCRRTSRTPGASRRAQTSDMPYGNRGRRACRTPLRRRADREPGLLCEAADRGRVWTPGLIPRPTQSAGEPPFCQMDVILTRCWRGCPGAHGRRSPRLRSSRRYPRQTHAPPPWWSCTECGHESPRVGCRSRR